MQQKVNEEYMVTATVENTTARVYVSINLDEEVTVLNDKKQPQFTFTRSKPEVIAAMAQALKEAAELVEARKVKAA